MISLDQDIFYIILKFSIIRDIRSLLLLNKFIYTNNKDIINTLWFKEKQIRSYFKKDIINFFGGIENLINIPFYYKDHFKVLNDYQKCPNIFLGKGDKSCYLVVKIRKKSKIITTILFQTVFKDSNKWFIKNLCQFCNNHTMLINPYINSFGSFNPLQNNSSQNNSILRHNLQTILSKVKNSLNNSNSLLLRYYDKSNLRIKEHKVYI